MSSISAGAFEALLRPRSLMVVGASSDPTRFGGVPLDNLRRFGYAGRIVAVNPRHDRIGDIECYASVRESPPTAAAIVAVPAPTVLGVLRECRDQGIEVATVVSSGFGELQTDEAQQRDSRLRELVDGGGLRILGPNTTGIVNLVDRYVPRASGNVPRELPRGTTAVLSQSGAVNNIILNGLARHGVGVSYGIATGNQADLTVEQLLEALVEDPHARDFLVFVEEIPDPVSLLAAVRRCTAVGKGVAILTLGRSPAGAAAARRHTGSRPNVDDRLERNLADAGALLVRDLGELIRVGVLLRHRVRPEGLRLGVVSMSGGEGGVVADVAAELGFLLPPPGSDTVAEVRASLQLTTPSNPLDTTGEILHAPERFRQCLRAYLEDPAFDVVLVALPSLAPVDAGRVLPAIEELASASVKPVVCTTWLLDGLTDASSGVIGSGRIAAGEDAAAWLRALRRVTLEN